MKVIKFPKIKQFRQVVTEITKAVHFVGLDENEKLIYDNSIKKPIISFSGSVKLHGTNSSFCYNNIDGFWTQSREQIITPESDNYGFSAFAYNIKNDLVEQVKSIAIINDIDLNVFTITVYGEWAGKGIQKVVGISQLDKSFYVFGIKVSNTNNPDFISYWINHSGFMWPELNIYQINFFASYLVDVDFNMPQLSQNKFKEITESIERECPVAKYFGVDNGLGEGAVWTANFQGKTYRFKVKGQKHSVTKVKKLASVDVEKLKSIQEFVDYAVTENRIDQAIEVTFKGEPIDRKKMGDFLRWIINDVHSEESDTLRENGLEPKDINKYISSRAREMFFKLESTF